MYVNEVMTTQVKTCRANTSLDEVARMMWDGNCGSIPIVTEDNKPVGIITDRDIAMAAMIKHQPLWEIHAASVIQGQNLYSCSQTDSIESCLQLMEEQQVRRLPVTDDAGALCGIVSMGDALAFTRGGNGSAQKYEKLNADSVLSMLKKVSAHHQHADQPLMMQ